jgi:exodeoxyribonuclease VII small subunit
LLYERLIYNHPVPKFEDCLQRLEQIVDQLEKGDIPLEQALALFEEGMKLSNDCRSELETAEGKVEILLKQSGKIQAEPFEGNLASNGPEKPSKK